MASDFTKFWDAQNWASTLETLFSELNHGIHIQCAEPDASEIPWYHKET